MFVPTETQERKALVFALCAVLLWSTVATGFKLGLEHLLPLQLLLTGTCISWVLFGIAASVCKTYKISLGELPTIVVLGTINPFAYYLIVFGSYSRLPAQIAQPILITWAIVFALLAVPILKQQITRQGLAGIALSYIGVLIVLSQNPIDADTPLSITGVALAFSSTLFWALYWLFNTRCESHPIAVMFYSFTVGLILVAAACWHGPGWPELQPTTIFYGAWVGLIEMGVTYLLWQKAIGLTGNVGRLGQLIFLTPFLSLILIGTILGEPIRATSVSGLMVIVGGIIIANRNKPSTTP